MLNSNRCGRRALEQGSPRLVNPAFLQLLAFLFRGDISLTSRLVRLVVLISHAHVDCRWLGQGTILMYSIHGITYMSMWTHDGV